MKRTIFLTVIVLLLINPIHAEDKWLINDGFVSGASVYYQAGFVQNEIMAAVFHPEAGDYPCQLKKVHTLVLDGTGGSTIGAFDLTIWEDNGTLNPGAVLFAESYQLTAGEAFNEIDLTAENIILPSGNVRVGFTFVLDPPPSFCRDGDGTIQSHMNLIFAQGLGWQWAETLGLTGDWIHRLMIDTNVSSATATPTIVPPTNTPTIVPPTNTPTIVPPTNTPEPTVTPTSEPGTPTATPTNTPVPTATSTNTATPTQTPTQTFTTPTPSFTPTQGPPPTATPTLNPSSVSFDEEEYFGMDAIASISVEDYDLNQDPLVQETVEVRVWSQHTDPYPAGLTVTLYEDGFSSNRFNSIYPHVGFGASSRPADNILGVTEGETIFVRYIDSTTSQELVSSAIWRSNSLYLEFLMPGTSFGEGDSFKCDLQFTNAVETVQVDLYVLLDVYGEFFVYPTWQSIDEGLPFDTSFIPGEEQGLFTIFAEFFMPAVSPSGPFYFYGAMFESGELTVETLLSNVAIAEFSLR